MPKIEMADDWYGCSGELQEEVYSEFNGNIYISEAEKLLEIINFNYKTSAQEKSNLIIKEVFSFGIESLGIPYFKDGFGVISFFNLKNGVCFSSLCKVEMKEKPAVMEEPLCIPAPCYKGDINKSMKFLSLDLFSGLTPSSGQKKRFLDFFDEAEEFFVRFEDCQNLIYEQTWRFRKGWFKEEINRCAVYLEEAINESQSIFDSGSIDSKEVERIMQVVPLWVAGEMLSLTKSSLTRNEFMKWLKDHSVSQELVSHEEIYKVYRVMCASLKN